MQFFAQSVDQHGNVGVTTNKALFYAGEPAPAATPGSVAPLLNGDAPPPNPLFRGDVIVGATSPTPGVTVQVSVSGPESSGGFVETFTATADGAYTVDVEGSDGSTATTSFVIDTEGPIVSIIGPPGPTSAPTFLINASEPGQLYCKLDSNPFAQCASPFAPGSLGDGPHSLAVYGVDGLDNTGDTVTVEFVVDATPPTVSSIVRTAPSPTNAATLPFTVTFSEAVTGVGSGNFTAAAAGVTGTPPAITAVVPSGSLPATTWTVTVSTAGSVGANNGSVRLDLTSAPGIGDAAGNPPVVPFVSGEAYVFDTTRPGLTIVLAAGQTSPVSSQPIRFVATFTEPVSGFDQTDVTLSGTAGVGAATVAVTGSAAVYDIAVSGVTGSGTVIVSVAAARAKDLAGNDNTPATATATLGTAPPPCTGPVPPGAIVGGNGNDTLDGTPGDDVIVDTGGNNRIDGKGGNDTICSRSGNDTIVGGDGNDTIVDTGGNNTVDGGLGNDRITTGTGNDRITAGDGDDVVTDAGGNNTVDVAGGIDTVTTGSGNDTIQGGAQADMVDAGGGNNTVDGGAGNDRITTGTGNDKITAGDGDDVVTDTGGNNTVDVGAGSDTVTTGGGNDVIEGGAQNDTINAGNGNNKVNGSAGDDRITTGSGNDTIDGGPGYDICAPGSGNNNVKNCEG